MKLRQRFLTKEEKAAHKALGERKRQEDMVKARKESRLRKIKARRERELNKIRAKTLMENNLQACEPEFRHLVQQWAKGKTVAKVNKFFVLLKEVKCPMEPCYNPEKLWAAEKVLRLNRCGYKKLCYKLNLPDAILGCDFWSKEYQREYDNAHELDSWLLDLWLIQMA